MTNYSLINSFVLLWSIRLRRNLPLPVAHVLSLLCTSRTIHLIGVWESFLAEALADLMHDGAFAFPLEFRSFL